ncbi:MAG: alkene reductase [Pseudomonadota bacterium]
MSNQTLFSPTRLGAIELKNRIVLAPLTRSRADADGVPADFAAIYYAQRAQAGLLITEATQISPEGKGYPRTPGLFSSSQLEGWRRIVDAVHAVGGKIVVQLWHVGRIASAANREQTVDTVAPSAIQAAGEMYTDAAGMQPHDMPRALETAEIPRLADEFAQAAVNAIDVGFDGIELHSANGYLLHQFLAENTNQRTDQYGGNIPNRARAPLEVLDAILAKVPSDRVGIRISPAHAFNDIEEGDTAALYDHYIGELNSRGLAYLHVMRPFANQSASDFVKFARARFRGNIIACGGYDAASAQALIAKDGADAVAFGQSFIANPDLPLRISVGAPLATPNRETFYSPGETGYTDYPVWSGATAA